MDIAGYHVEPLTADRFDDFVSVIGTGGIGGCWCMYWALPTVAEWREGARGGSKARNRGDFLAWVEEGPPPGLIAYDGGVPVAWCRVVPRDRLPALSRSRFFKTELDTTGVWSLPCFVVKRTHRGRGLTEVLIRAALLFAREHGARALEAYPWDTDEQKDPGTIYTGVASTFSRLGFRVVQRLAPHKPMMRRTW